METPVSSIVQTGDLGGQKVQMTFDQNSLAHLMSVLTDLYSDPQLAVIREYSTNALDAHVEAGNTDPIQVFTPTAMSPYFVVRDFGIGLSVDDITDMYSKYGASSKRNTNSQVGMLGLGAKSALTLVPQFNVTSVRGGVKIFVSVSRSSDGSGQMEIIDTSATNEPNGTEIKIPVPRNHEFAKKCREFFRFWKKGTVLVDGKEPEYITGRPVGDKFLVNKELQQDYIVMGNVAYPCKDSLYAGGYSYGQLGIVAFVGIGEVNFTPSREALQYTPQTRATLDRLKAEFQNNLVKSINEDIATSATHAEAWKKAREWRASFYGRVKGLTYKGVEIPDSVQVADGKEFYIGRARNRYASWVRGVSPEYASTHIFITGFAASMKISPVQREKVATYCENNGLTFDKLVLTDKPTFQDDPKLAKWLTDFTIVDWSVIAKIKVERNKATNKVIRTDPYDLYDGRYGSTQVSTLDTSKEIIYYSTAELRYPMWLSEMFPNAQIILLNRNRWEKFNRDYPTGKHYLKAIEDAQQSMVDSLTDSDKILWHYNNYRYHVRGLDATKIDDPELHKFIEVLSDPKADYSDDAKKLRSLMRREIPVPSVPMPVNPLTKYPLVGNMNGTESEHFYWYLNTYYAFLTSKEN